MSSLFAPTKYQIISLILLSLGQTAISQSSLMSQNYLNLSTSFACQQCTNRKWRGEPEYWARQIKEQINFAWDFELVCNTLTRLAAAGQSGSLITDREWQSCENVGRSLRARVPCFAHATNKKKCVMWLDGWMDGKMGGWMDGWMMDGWMEHIS